MTEPVHDMKEWDGGERRSIPIHILNHVDERLSEHAGKVEKVFLDHTEEEMERYQEIQNKISEIQRQQASMISSLTSYMEKQEKFHADISGAFPLDDDGKPDFKGHGKAHKTWIANSERDNALLDYVELQKKKDEESSSDWKYYKRAAVAAILAPLSFWAAVTLYHGAVPNSQPVKQEATKG